MLVANVMASNVQEGLGTLERNPEPLLLLPVELALEGRLAAGARVAHTNAGSTFTRTLAKRNGACAGHLDFCPLSPPHVNLCLEDVEGLAGALLLLLARREAFTSGAVFS